MTKHGLGHEYGDRKWQGRGEEDELEGDQQQSQVTGEMRVLNQLVLLTTLVTSCRAYFLHGIEGYPDLRYNFHDGPPPPEPLEEPPPHHNPFLHPATPLHAPVFHDNPLIYRAPPQTVVVHVPVRGIFPPFIERIVQRIQTFWSVYNPPELLTRPPPVHVFTTTKRPTKRVSTTTTASTSESTPSTHSSDVMPSEDTTTKVSTLAVFEVTPTSTTQDSTPEPPSLEGAEADTEEPLFITPERASALGQKEAFLRFLRTGQVPPFLQPDSLNEMAMEEDMFT